MTSFESWMGVFFTFEYKPYIIVMILMVTSIAALGKLVTEKPVDFAGFDNVVEFNKNLQNDGNVVKAYIGIFS